MAEINIQRKKRRISPWPLILAVLVLLALGAWYLISRDPQGTAPTPDPPAAAGSPVATPGAPTGPAAAQAPDPTAPTGDPSVGSLAGEEAPAEAGSAPADYYAFLADDPAGTDYARRGLSLLTAVLTDLADRPDLRNPAVEERRNDLTSATSRLAESNASLRPGFVAVAELLQEMQRRGYPTAERDARQLVEKAGQLSGRTGTAAEQQAAQDFFQQAGNLLRVLEKPVG